MKYNICINVTLTKNIIIMAFDSKYSSFGVLKVDGRSVKVYNSNSSYSSISVGYDINDARWAGSDVLVQLADVKVRRYSSFSSYTTI